MASVDAQFTSLMDDMASFSDKIGKYLRSDTTQRLWMIPAGYSGGWTFDPVDIPNIGDPFDRTDVNLAYVGEYTGGGEDKIKVAMGLNVEVGYMCMMERAFRERHRTCTRALMLLAGRCKAHGDATNGVHKASVEGFVQELLATS